MKTGHNLLVLMLMTSILALIPKRIRFRRKRAKVAVHPPRAKKGTGSRMVWTARDEAEWGSGTSDNK